MIPFEVWFNETNGTTKHLPQTRKKGVSLTLESYVLLKEF